MRIYLTGFMGSGKTTVGRLLAGNLNQQFFDLDHGIERKAGMAIQEIFGRSGEEAFRKLETETLQSINIDSAVIATGGGCFIHNEEWMLQNGTVVYLRVPFAILAQRVGADASRPLWRNAEKLFTERETIYTRAHFNVDGSAPPTEVVKEIKKFL